MNSLNSPIPVASSRLWVNRCVESVPAGYPSPISEQAKELVDINSHLMRNEIATYIFRFRGDAMIDAGIFDGDVLVVDRSVEPKNNDIVLATLNDQFIVKRFCQQDGLVKLISENPIYPPLVIKEKDDFAVWGVVTNSVHKLC